MANEAGNKNSFSPEPFSRESRHFREVRRRNIARLLFTYIGPLIILTVFFIFQYDSIFSTSRRLHLKAIAENQSNLLDLYLSERLVNLTNLINDPRLMIPPESGTMANFLQRLKQNSEAFVDIGFFDSSGIQIQYAGPFSDLEKKNYSSESWYIALRQKDDNFIITDIYLGFREKPHFTIGVSRIIDNQYAVLRATLDPEKIYEYIRSLEGSGEVQTSIVNKDGYYQLVTSQIGTPLDSSSFVPPEEPRLGAGKVEINNNSISYAYSWLWTADWALIVQPSAESEYGILHGPLTKIIIISLILIAAGLAIVWYRANKVTNLLMETEQARAQLEHAAKLASVGELAAGIAHEINNPLAAINEEAGLMKDLMDPDLGEPVSPAELRQHLDSIQESVFRCRDITRKLLGFVRKTDFDLKKHDIHKLIDGVIDGLLGREIAVSNVRIERDYDNSIPEITTDGNQLQQVILNMVNNSIDAIGKKPGRITVKTEKPDSQIRIDISDTGNGMTREQLDKIFLPFYTTKEVGKGTGLGLSVSYGILKSLGGKIEVQSAPGKGSTFSILLPIR